MGPRFERAARHPRLARRDARRSSALAAAQAGIEVVAEAGIDAIRAKGIALTEYAIALHDAWLAPLGCSIGSPRDPPAAAPTSRSATRTRSASRRELIARKRHPRLPRPRLGPRSASRRSRPPSRTSTAASRPCATSSHDIALTEACATHGPSASTESEIGLSSSGSPAFLNSFFSTVAVRAEGERWGRKPHSDERFHAGRVGAATAETALRRARRHSTDAVHAVPIAGGLGLRGSSRAPTLGRQSSATITSLGDYFVTSDGEDLIDVLREALGHSLQTGEEARVE